MNSFDRLSIYFKLVIIYFTYELVKGRTNSLKEDIELIFAEV